MAWKPSPAEAGAIRTTIAATFSGPLPPPAVLQRYNSAIPNGAERIMAMVERQAEHRQKLESRAVDGNLAAQSRGQWMALVVVFAGFVSGVTLIALGKSTEGLAALFGPLSTTVALLLYTRNAQTRERADKREQLNSSVPSPQE
jgi:uncharacterized membrane protein